MLRENTDMCHLRERAKIKPNDKLAIIGMEREETVCCIVMIKTEALGTTVKQMLGPIFDEALNKGVETE